MIQTAWRTWLWNDEEGRRHLDGVDAGLVIRFRHSDDRLVPGVHLLLAHALPWHDQHLGIQNLQLGHATSPLGVLVWCSNWAWLLAGPLLELWSIISYT